MELFSISCTTCKSRLKVREESAIGQILACPSCGGMVMVKPPEGWQKGAPAQALAPHPPAGLTAVVEVRRPGDTIGDSQFDAVDELLSDAPPKVRAGTVTVAPDAPGLARPRFAGAPQGHASGHGSGAHGSGVAPPPTNGAPRNGAARSHQTPGVMAVAEPPRAKADVPPPPSDDGSEPAPPRPRRYGIMLAGSMAAGVLLAVLAVMGVMRVLQENPRPLVQAGSSGTAANLPSTPGTPQPVVPKEPVPTEPVPPASPAPAETLEPDVPAEIPAPAEAVEPALPTEPAPPAANPLAPFENILATDTADPFANPDPLALPAETTPAEAIPAETEAATPALARPAPRVVDVPARLADPLPAIDAAGVPLVDFLRFIADFSTIAISLEPDGLPFARGSSVSPVMVKASGTTVGAALGAGLKSLGLEAIEVDGQLVVRVIEPTPLPTLRYPVADLTGGDEQAAAELAETLQALIEPASWIGESGGTITVNKDELAIVQRRAVHLQLVVLCEKLRTARKLRHKTSFDPSLFKLDTRSASARERLQAPISLNYSRPTTLVRILDRLEQAGGMRILVDWRDIASAGWNSDGEATLLVDKQPLSVALTRLLEPMDLAWRIVDGQTVQVVTPATLTGKSDLEFYQVADLLKTDPTGAALLAQVRAGVGEQLLRDAGGPFEVRFDEAGRVLITALPQPKQQELEALFAKWRSGAAK